MTALALTAQRIIPYAGIKNRMERMEDAFLTVNARGFLSMALIGLAAAGASGYVLFVAQSFELGIRLRAAGIRQLQEERETKKLQTMLREEEANFTLRHQADLADMDKVSSVVYLDAGSVAMNMR